MKTSGRAVVRLREVGLVIARQRFFVFVILEYIVDLGKAPFSFFVVTSSENMIDLCFFSPPPECTDQSSDSYRESSSF